MCSASGRHWKHVTAVVIFLYIQNNLNDPHFSWCVGFTYCPLLIKKKKEKKIPAYFFLKPFKENQFLERKFSLLTSISLAIPEDAEILSLSC